MKWYKGKRIYLKRINNFLELFGFQIKKILDLKYLFRYLVNLYKFNKSGGKINNIYPILRDYNSDGGGELKNHLFHSDLLTSQYVFEAKHNNHLDIGSRIDGLVTQIASFRKIDVIDIRPVDIRPHKNINFIQSDICDTNFIQKNMNKYDSISSIGCIAHVGLGRYGDDIDINGHEKAIQNLSSLAMKNGKIYIMAPIGYEIIEFNAHRIFKPNTIVDIFQKNYCTLENFHLINDQGNLILNANLNENMNYNFAGGYYVFKKQQN